MFNHTRKTNVQKPSSLKSGAGFTLLESLMYLALFAIIMTGVLSAAYGMVELFGRNQAKSLVQEEGTFLLGKINWALSSVQTVNQPPVGSPGPTLSVRKWAAGADTVVNLVGGSIEQDLAALNNSSVQASGLTFTHTGSGSQPESVTASFTLQAKTPTGNTYSQPFFTTKYLRK